MDASASQRTDADAKALSRRNEGKISSGTSRGIIKERGQKLIAIYCTPDHTHILIGLKPTEALSDLVRVIKTNSAKHINEQHWVMGRFSWQEGFGAFSYAHSQLGAVIEYIENQEEHHRRKTFREEYLAFLEKFRVSFDKKYLFEELE